MEARFEGVYPVWTRNPTTLLWLVVAVAIALVPIACGDSGSSSSVGAPTPTTTSFAERQREHLEFAAAVFTTHPGPFGADDRIGGNGLDTIWKGGTSMPRTGQHENVALVLYGAETPRILGGLLAGAYPDFTHAYFPLDEFDEVVGAGPRSNSVITRATTTRTRPWSGWRTSCSSSTARRVCARTS